MGAAPSPLGLDMFTEKGGNPGIFLPWLSDFSKTFALWLVAASWIGKIIFHTN